MKIYGIIGRPLGHSFSKRYFEEKFAALGLADHRYLAFPLESIAELSDVLTEYPDLTGFNVTIPYKKEIIPLLDEVSPEAAAIGAVNCVKVADGRLLGYNTDAAGFAAGVTKLIGRERPLALVLGTGGASLAVRYVLGRSGIDYRVVSRTKTADTLTYDEVTPETIETHRLIINTTPLGTWPDTESRPRIPYEALTPHHFLYDLVYNPPVTAFLAEGVKRGAATLNGEIMLVRQAEESWKIWETLT
jgi:shikimate dehydrogenase